jgi:ABC-type nitrate/sulfonate/bicarbonate transport system substrate-binding protein
MIDRRAPAALAILLVASPVGGCARPASDSPAKPPASASAPASGSGAAAAGSAAAPGSATGPAAASAAPATAMPSRPKESLTFAIPQRNLNYIVPMAAAALGFFDEAGLDVKVEALAPNLTLAAMQRGDLKITGSGGSAIRTAVRGDASFRLISFMTVQATYFVITVPEIRTPQQLVGKRIGVGAVADTPHLFTERWLRDRGMDPSQILFLAMGANPAVHVTAMQAGALDGAVLDPASTAVAEAQGFHLLQALGEVAPAPQQGVVTTAEYLQSNPESVRAFLKGLVRGLRYGKQNPREMAAIARQELGLEMDEAISQRAVQLYLDGVSAQAPGYADEKLLEGFYQYDVRLPLELPAEQPIPALHDFRLLLEVYDELGIPRPR